VHDGADKLEVRAALAVVGVGAEHAFKGEEAEGPDIGGVSARAAAAQPLGSHLRPLDQGEGLPLAGERV